MPYADLHTHSRLSDGDCSPEELIGLAQSRGIQALALTDHDTTGGLIWAECAALEAGIQFIPGIELSVAIPDGTMHLLGYYIDYSSDRANDLEAVLAWSRSSRIERSERMVQKLNELRVPVSLQRVKEIAGNASISRVHIAKAMVEVGSVPTIKHAFESYIGYGKPAYFGRFRLSPDQAIRLIIQAGGVPVLAHPRDVLGHLPVLVDAGLAGLEAWYAGYELDLQKQLDGVAQRYGLISTGGSDFHSLTRKDYRSSLGQQALSHNTIARLERQRDALRTKRLLGKKAENAEWYYREGRKCCAV